MTLKKEKLPINTRKDTPPHYQPKKYRLRPNEISLHTSQIGKSLQFRQHQKVMRVWRELVAISSLKDSFPLSSVEPKRLHCDVNTDAHALSLRFTQKKDTYTLATYARIFRHIVHNSKKPGES